MESEETKIQIDLIENNATLDILKKNPNLFLLQAGYLTFGDFESGNETSLRFPNNEVQTALLEVIFETLKLKLQFTIEEFENFLNETTRFLELFETKNTEDLDLQFKEIFSALRKFFEDTIKECQLKSKKTIDERTKERFLTDLFSMHLRKLKWKNWVSVYQGEILNEAEKPDIRKSDFLFTKPNEQTDIYLEFLKSNWDGHISRNYHEKSSFHTKNIIEIFYMFSKFNKVEKFGVRGYRKEGENLKLVFERFPKNVNFLKD